MLMVAAEMGLLELGDVAIDGSKFKANASKHKVMSWGRACALEDQQAWNVQSAVDMDSHLIVGGYICQATNDKQQLTPALDALKTLPEQLGDLKRMTADNGYYSTGNIDEAA